MGLNKAQLSKKVADLEATIKLLEAKVADTPTEETETVTVIKIEDLLTKLNGFESAVAEVKHLKSKAAASESKLLSREVKIKLEAINAVLKSVNKVVV